MPNKVKIQAKDVSEAIAKGLKELGLRRDQVEVTVLEAPKKGFLGIGSRPAVVEVRQKRWTSANLDSQIYMDVPKKRSVKSERGSRGGRGGRKERGERSERVERFEGTETSARPARGNRRGGRRSERMTSEAREPRELREKTPKANEPQMLPCEAIRNTVIPEHLKAPMQEAKEYLEKVLTQMGVKVENLNVWWDEKQQRILLTFDCDHPAIVIGKEGKTLEAIQYLSTLALSRHFDKPISVITDTQNYWRKAEDKIDAEVAKGVDMITRGHSVFRFRPMSAQLRRYIHRAVEGNDLVATASEGEGKWRKVTLRPTAKALEANRANTAPADFVPGVIGEDITPAQEAVSEAEAEQNLSNYSESCSCCSGECQSEAHEVSVETAKETIASEAQGATCTAEIARNCGEGDAQGGCSCEHAAVQPEAAPVVTETVTEDDAQGGTCSVELARNCQEGEVQSGCACGPLFETPAEADKQNETK